MMKFMKPTLICLFIAMCYILSFVPLNGQDKVDDLTETEENSVEETPEDIIYYDIPLQDPRLDPLSIHHGFRSVNTLIGEGLQQFTEKGRKEDPQIIPIFNAIELFFDYELASYTAVVAHEYGHFRVADQYGWDPDVHLRYHEFLSGLVTYEFPFGRFDLFPGGFSGVTRVDVDYSERDWPQKLARVYAAGIVQEQRNADRQYFNLSRGEGSIMDAVAFLHQDMATWRYPTTGASNGGDISSFSSILKNAGIDAPSKHRIKRWGMISVLLNPAWWDTLYSLIFEFVADNDRDVTTHSIPIGSTTASIPQLSYYPGVEEHVVNLSSLITFPNTYPIYTTIGSSIDWDCFRLGARVLDVKYGDFIFEPFAAASSWEEGLGFDVGGSVTYKVNDTFSLGVEAGIARDDLMRTVVEARKRNAYGVFFLRLFF